MAVDAPTLSDPERFGLRQRLVVALAFFVVLIDGMDVQLLALSSPQLLHEWSLSKLAFAPVLAAAVLGIVPGAAVGGWAADRLGRRPVIIFSVLAFGCATLAAAHAHSMEALFLARLIGGLGFGAALPTSISLALEWSPARSHPTVATFFPCGSPSGGLVAATLAIWILPVFGWRRFFLIGGFISLGLAVALLLLLPESPEFRRRGLRSKRPWHAPASEVDDMPSIEFSNTVTRANSGEAPQNRWAHYLRLLIGSCLAMFVFGVTTQTFTNWLPVIMTDAGAPLRHAIRASQTFNALGLLSVLIAPWLIRRVGSRNATILWTITAQLMLILFVSRLGHQHGRDDILALTAIGVFAATVGSSIGTTYAVMGAGYPSDMRATGIGLAVTSLRIGAVVVILAGGAILQNSPHGGAFLLQLVCAILIFALVASYIINIHIASGKRIRAT